MGKKGSNRVRRGESGCSPCTSWPTLCELGRVQFLATARGTQAGLEVGPARHLLLASAQWRLTVRPQPAHLCSPFPAALFIPTLGAGFSQVVPRGGGYFFCINTFWNAELSSPSCPPITKIQGEILNPYPVLIPVCYPTQNSKRTGTYLHCLKIHLYFLKIACMFGARCMRVKWIKPQTSTWRPAWHKFYTLACNLLKWQGSQPQESVCIWWSGDTQTVKRPGTYHKNLEDARLFWITVAPWIQKFYLIILKSW